MTICGLDEGRKDVADELGKALPWVWEVVGGRNDIAKMSEELDSIKTAYMEIIINIMPYSEISQAKVRAHESGFTHAITQTNAHLTADLYRDLDRISKEEVSKQYMMAYELGKTILELYNNQKTELLGGI